MTATVDALLPLSFLLAVRGLDTPSGDTETEFVSELRNKRLGLSETVYAQIQRYTDAAKRQQRAGQDEAVGIARLIGRRPDAEAVFRAAGRHLAREAYAAIPAPTRRVLVSLPPFLARTIALRWLRRIAERYLNGRIRRVGPSVVLEVSSSVTLDSAPAGSGCAYYEAALRELLRLLAAGGGSVAHVRCSSRGEGVCEWTADWRSVERRRRRGPGGRASEEGRAPAE
jgi:predicted hydrocarbon binding protein